MSKKTSFENVTIIAASPEKMLRHIISAYLMDCLVFISYNRDAPVSVIIFTSWDTIIIIIHRFHQKTVLQID